MSTFDYEPNSHRSKTEGSSSPEEKKRVEKVVKGNVTVKKKSGSAKVKDEVKSVGSYLITDVVIPSAKKLLVDFVKDGIEMLAYGSARRGDRRPTVDKFSYDKRYIKADDRYPAPQPRSRAQFDYDTISFDSYAEADMVLTRLDEVIETYGHARVSDLYDLIGMSCSYTYNDYGWTNLSTAKIAHTRDGYVLDMPRALPLRR